MKEILGEFYALQRPLTYEELSKKFSNRDGTLHSLEHLISMGCIYKLAEDVIFEYQITEEGARFLHRLNNPKENDSGIYPQLKNHKGKQICKSRYRTQAIDVHINYFIKNRLWKELERYDGIAPDGSPIFNDNDHC